MNITKYTEKVSRLIPLIYPLLIFIGFYNQHVYYNHFGIEIFNYLSVYEILFSFIRIATPILIGVFGLVLYFILIYTGGVDDDSKEEEDDDEVFSLIYGNQYLKLKKNINNLFKSCLKLKILKSISHLLSACINLIGLIIKISLWLFFCFYSISLLLLALPSQDDAQGYYFFDTQEMSVLTGCIWIVMLFAILNRRIGFNLISKVHYNSLLLSALFLLMLAMISLGKKRRMENFYSTTDFAQISFVYEGKTIKTDNCFLFIGKTSEYIFLRDVEKNNNSVFKLSKISFLQLPDIN